MCEEEWGWGGGGGGGGDGGGGGAAPVSCKQVKSIVQRRLDYKMNFIVLNSSVCMRVCVCVCVWGGGGGGSNGVIVCVM